jgi:hypothetical protein
MRDLLVDITSKEKVRLAPALVETKTVNTIELEGLVNQVELGYTPQWGL